MVFVVDTNILFSACLTPAGKIFDILFNAPSSVQLISSQYAIEELLIHKNKLIKLSGLNDDEIEPLIASILKQVDFYNSEIIEKHNLVKADRLTKNVDSKDIIFVALALQNEGYLWTGDKKLTIHLRKQGFNNVVNTAELAEMLNIN